MKQALVTSDSPRSRISTTVEVMSHPTDEDIERELDQIELVTGIVEHDDHRDMTDEEIAMFDVWAFDPERDVEHDDERGGE